MKSFTDIEQSKRLAKILPLESADMWWLYITAQGKHIAMMYEEPDPHYLARMESYGIKNAAIPCWSLAALVSILPAETRLLKSATDDNFHIDCPKCNVNKWFDNPVDACVEMIENLHKKMIYDFNND